MKPEEYRRLFENVRKRPGMYLIHGDFATVVAFVAGCDTSGLLTGFREWLVTRVGCGDNLVWWALVVRLVAPPDGQHPGKLDAATDARAVAMLFACLDEFLRLRSEPGGLERIHAAHSAWIAARQRDGCRATEAARCPAVEWPRPSAT